MSTVIVIIHYRKATIRRRLEAVGVSLDTVGVAIGRRPPSAYCFVGVRFMPSAYHTAVGVC